MNYTEHKKRQEKLGIVHFIEDNDEIFIDLNEVASASDRVNEISVITKTTAPELCEALGKSHRSLDIIVNRVKYVKNKAESDLERLRALLRLHDARADLKTLGLKETESNINAQIELNQDYIQLVDLINYLKWVIDDLESRREEIRRAHSTARGIAGAVEIKRNSFSMSSIQDEPVGVKNFGKPSY